MTELYGPAVTALAAVLIAAIVCGAALKAWRGWIDLKRLEMAARREDNGPRADEPVALIEMASVKERLRRLEAIANGVEL